MRDLSPRLLLAAVCFAEVLSMAAFATFPGLLPIIQPEWGLNNTEAGWISGVYFAGYVAAVSVLVSLTDRMDARGIYLVCMALAVASALGFAIAAEGVWSASMWRGLQGIALAGTYMPGLKALTDRLPVSLQSRGVAFYTSSFGVGSSLSFLVAGEVEAVLNWHWAFGLSAAGPLLAFVIAAIVLRPRPMEAPAHQSALLDFRRSSPTARRSPIRSPMRFTTPSCLPCVPGWWLIWCSRRPNRRPARRGPLFGPP